MKKWYKHMEKKTKKKTPKQIFLSPTMTIFVYVQQNNKAYEFIH